MPPNSRWSGRKKKQRRSYSGKKKRHTTKSQIIADQQEKRIIATAFAEGRRHDFALFKESGLALSEWVRALADSGYQGLEKLHPHSQTPKRRSKLHPLTKEERAANRSLAKERIVVEHIIRALKIFRILSERYRNRRRRYGLRFNLIAALYNHELDLP